MINFDHIAGYKKEIESLKEIKTLFQRYSELNGMGIRLPHGLLLGGEPGVGKTIMAEAIISETDAYCVRINAGEPDEDELTDYINEKFDEAKNHAPAIVFMDELDKLVGEPDGFRCTYNMKNSRKVLQAMNNHKEDGILVIATINEMDMLCEALKRSGRFDRILMIDLPTQEDRKEIIHYYLSGKPLDKTVDLDMLVKMTSGMSGADIECLINEAGIHAVLNKRKTITQKDLDHSIEQKVFRGYEREQVLSEGQKKVIATHEVGHLLLGLMLRPDNVSGVSILPQGESAGHCSIAPICQVIPSLTDIKNKIKIDLAGRACEHVFFPNEVFLGSSSDIEHAIAFADKAIKEEGAFGLEFCCQPEGAFPPVTISEDKMRQIEQKRNELLKDCYREAEKCISDNKALAQVFIKILCSRLSLTRTEILKTYERYLTKERTKIRERQKGTEIKASA